jgi:hypothetical protein
VARCPTRAEAEQARRRGWHERLRREGVLVRLRASIKNSGEVTGYSVGLACHTNRDGGVVAQLHAAQAAAARQAAEHIRGFAMDHRPGCGPTEVNMRASDVARMDVPAGLKR